MTPEQRESIRCYESVERIAWIRELPCVVPGCANAPRENQHVQILKDGRPAGSAFVVPMCAAHREVLTHGVGSVKFEALYHLDLKAEALDVELRWRQHQAACAVAPEDVPA